MRFLRELGKVHKTALIITAHPDDESIFMGGTIAELKKWSWRILCVTDCDERYNMIRRRELVAVCDIYKRHGSGIEPFMLAAARRRKHFDKKEIAGKINDFLRLAGIPDIVFTHGKTGEYGHKTHCLIYDVVNKIGLSNIYAFSSHSLRTRRADMELVRLSDNARSVKKAAIGLYLRGSQKTNLSRLHSIVESALSAKVEAFCRPE